jgi:hypothetical protein
MAAADGRTAPVGLSLKSKLIATGGFDRAVLTTGTSSNDMGRLPATFEREGTGTGEKLSSEK